LENISLHFTHDNHHADDDWNDFHFSYKQLDIRSC